MRSFAATERFVAEVASGKLKPAYLLVGDEAFLRNQCRQAVLRLVPALELREFAVHDLDLSEAELAEVLDQARTPSLMAPFQIFLVRGVSHLYGRGSKEGWFAAIRDYVERPNPDTLIVFIADHIAIPADVRRMEMTDRERYERIRETLGPHCGIVELARVEENDAVNWIVQTGDSQGIQIEADAARELADALGGDMMGIASELQKLLLYAAETRRLTLADVETMVLAAKQRSLYELTDAISGRDRVRALEVMQALLATSEGEDSAIGHVFMLAKTFRQMLVVSEKKARDSRALWQVLWPGFRVPPFAAEDLIRQARRYSPAQLSGALRLIARADLDLRSNPPSKRLVLEKLVLDLTGDYTSAARQGG
jgi:DNA polymerase-3 subunit delta